MNGETTFKIFFIVLAGIFVLLLICALFFNTPQGYYLETLSYCGVNVHRVRENIRFGPDRTIFAHHDHNEVIRVYNEIKED